VIKRFARSTRTTSPLLHGPRRQQGPTTSSKAKRQLLALFMEHEAEANYERVRAQQMVWIAASPARERMKAWAGSGNE